MGDHLVSSATAIATAIIGVAIIAVIVGSKNTSGVISSAGKAFASVLSAATAPASGGISGGISPINTF